MGLVKEISLSNHLVVEIWDHSRAIAADTTKVELSIKINVVVNKDYFDNPKHFDIVTRVFGQEISYEYKKERTFVHREDKEKVFSELLNDLTESTLPYI